MELHNDKRTGWKAQTDYELGVGVTLEIVTRKTYSGDLESTAKVWKVKPNGIKSHGFGIGDDSYGDFSKTVIKSKDRCTEKNVRVQHGTAEAQAELLKAEALAFYARKAKQTEAA